MQAALQNPSDEKAAGLAKLACGKIKTNFKFQGLNIQRHEISPEKKAAPQALQPTSRQQDLGGSVAAIPAVAPGSVSVGATSYDKTIEAQDAAVRGRSAEAAAAASEAIALDPRNTRAYALLAAAWEAQGEWERSLEAARAGLKINAASPALLKSKALAQIQLGDFKGALDASDSALKANATDPMAHVLRAFTLGRLGDRIGMIDALRTASALDPVYERLFIEAQNSKEDSLTPFTLPGQERVKAPNPLESRKTAGNRPQKKIFFLGLLLALAVVGALFVQSLAAYWARRSETGEE